MPKDSPRHLRAFSSYWQAYASDKEAGESPKDQWSEETIGSGIMAAAIQSLAVLLGGTERTLPTVEQRDESIFGLSHNIAYGRIRVSILGAVVRDHHRLDSLKSEIEDCAREALCICILSKSNLSVWSSSERLRSISGAGIVVIYPDDMDALARGEWTFPELLEYKLHRRLVLDKPDPDTQYDAQLLEELRDAKTAAGGAQFRELNDVISELPGDLRSWPENPLVARATSALKAGRNCLLSGPSSSGKSVLSLQLGKRLALNGWKVIHLNLGTTAALPGDALNQFILQPGADNPELAILDDLQSSPAGSRYLLAVADLARRASLERPPVILALTWPDYASEVTATIEDFLLLAVQPHQIRQELVRRYGSGLPPEDSNDLVDRFGEDLFLLREALESGSAKGRRPDLREIAEAIWVTRTSRFSGNPDVPKKVTLVAGSLGRFDIAVPRPFLLEESQAQSDELSSLQSAGLLRKTRDYLTIGHRSLCALLTDWLTEQNAWELLRANRGPQDSTSVVLDYLRSLDSGMAVDTLRALYARAGFKQMPNLNSRAVALVEIWKAFDALVERIVHQQHKDPEWARTPSSAMFAVQSLMQVGRVSIAKPSVDFMRRHWRVENDQLHIDVGGLSTVNDFLQIGKSMEAEDALIEKSGTSPFNIPAADIDLERFHKTWLSGVFLCAEAAFNGESKEAQILADAIEGLILESGAFYPERVPWPTARIILGLAACGRSIHTSAAVAKCTEWLLKDKNEGGASNGGLWQSGTGTWNSTLETTGMVLLALAAAGVDYTDPRLLVARSYIKSQSSQWVAPGKALDGALALQAYLDIGGNWDEVASEAQQLSQWALGEALWRGALASAAESFQQSCKVAQIASHLINIGWSAIRSDLPAFLDALATPVHYNVELSVVTGAPTPQKPLPAPTQTMSSASPQLEPKVNPREEEAIDCLKRIDRLSLGGVTVIGDYRRYNERVRNDLIDRAHRIISSFDAPSIAHENYLIWAAPGSGKSFFVQEIAAALGGRVAYRELNLSKQSRDEFTAALKEVSGLTEPTLCLLDEIDARADEEWPYDEIFSNLDLNLSPDRNFVFVLVGSSSPGINAFVRNIKERYKGKDLMDRVPISNRFEIPPMILEDKVAIIASHIRNALRSRTQPPQIEKFALYYIMVNEDLSSPRQLRDLAITAAQRVPNIEFRVRYDDLFPRGDHRNQRFWIQQQRAVAELTDTYIQVED